MSAQEPPPLQQFDGGFYETVHLRDEITVLIIVPLLFPL